MQEDIVDVIMDLGRNNLGIEAFPFRVQSIRKHDLRHVVRIYGSPPNFRDVVFPVQGDVSRVHNEAASAISRTNVGKRLLVVKQKGRI